MKKEDGEGGRIRAYLKRNKINQTELANKMGLTRQGLIFHLGKEKVDYEFKMKLKEAGADVFGMGDNNYPTGESKPHSISPPETRGDMFSLMREVIEALKGENDVQKRYIRLLEDRLKD